MKNRKLLFICTVILLCACLLSGCRAVSRIRHSASEALVKPAEVIDTEPLEDCFRAYGADRKIIWRKCSRNWKIELKKVIIDEIQKK